MVLIRNVTGVVAAIRNGDAVRTQEVPTIPKILLNPKATFVYECVVLRAQQHEVVDARLTVV